MRAGRLIRQASRLDAAEKEKCPSCGHLLGQHFELPYGTAGYKPLVFHCKVEECKCSHEVVAA